MKATSDVPDDWPPAHDQGEQPRKERPSYRVLADLFQYRIVSFGEGRCVAEWNPGPPFVNSAGGVWGGAQRAPLHRHSGGGVVAPARAR